MSRIKDESDIDERVDIIASGYEWVCPICESFYHEIECNEKVYCSHCKRTFEVNPPEHCYG